MERSRAARNWAKVKDLLVGRKPAQSKLTTVSLFSRTTVRQDEKHKIVEYACGNYQWLCCEKPVAINVSSVRNAGTHAVDSTGWWVWPAQELLAYYIIVHAPQQNVRSVLELGAGSSGMAALCSYLRWKPENVTITDGRCENLLPINETLACNKFEDAGIEIKELIWGASRVAKKFELVLAADCLFFEHYHSELIATLKDAMDSSSLALFLNPKRGSSMENFLQLVSQSGFKYRIKSFGQIVETERYKACLSELSQGSRQSLEEHEHFLIELTLP